MTSKINVRTTPWLLAAGLAFGSAAAQAATGVTVTERQESAVAVGMGISEVQQALGRPAHIVKYANEPGPTWIYETAQGPFGAKEFDIDFGSDGKVVSASEVVEGGGGGGGAD